MKQSDPFAFRQTYISILLISCIGILISAFMFLFVRDRDLQGIQAEFNLAAMNRINSIKREIESNIGVLQSVYSFFESSEHVTREEFHTFSMSSLSRGNSIKALKWIPRVSHLQRNTFEKEAQADGYPDFKIIEAETSGKTDSANEAKEYFPVYYIEPYEGNESALGVDLSYNPVLLEALNKSCDTGEAAITSKVALMQNKEEQFGFLMFIPVYRNRTSINTVKERRENLIGFVSGTFRTEAIVNTALKYLEAEGIDIYLFDTTQPLDKQFLHFHSSLLNADENQPEIQQKAVFNYNYNDRLCFSHTFNVVDRKWMIFCKSVPEYIMRWKNWHPWGFLFGSLLFTGLLAVYLKNIFNRTEDLEQRVKERTIALESKNEELTTQITEREKIEEELKKINEELDLRVNERTKELSITNEELRKLSQAVEQSISSIVITDIKGNIQYVNPKFSEITGYTSAEAIGKNPRILKSGKTTPAEYKALWKTITSGKSWQGEFYNKKKNGEFYWELAQITPMKNKEGEITNFLAIKEDITDMKRTDAEQAELKEQLYHAQKLESVGRLAGGIAHDFNNILMAIIGYANLLQFEVKDTAHLGKYVENILATAENATKLTKSMLAFSRKQPINTKPEEINKVVKAAELLINRLIGEDIEYKLILSDENPVAIVESSQIEQVIMNLVTNAIDAMSEKGTLTIRTDIEEIKDEFIKTRGFGKKGKYAVISVSDTGTGMESETMKKIFEPFFTTKDTGKGTGLGLSIIYGIAKQHDGFIDVHSEYGKGTTFSLYLPLVDRAVEKAELDTKKIDVPEVGSETILIAEDSESVRFLIKEALERFGYKVIAAINGEEAITRFKEHKDNLDLLILDVKMPKKNGKEAYDEIRKIMPEIKAIFLSGYSEDAIDKDIFKENGLFFLQKPILPTKLIEKVRDVLRKNRNVAI